MPEPMDEAPQGERASELVLCTHGTAAAREGSPPTHIRRRRFRIGSINQWYEAFVLLNFVDVVLTIFFVQRGGYETNPVGAFIAEHYGWASLASFKFAQCILVILISTFLYRRRRKIARLIMGLACVIYFGLMIWDSVLLLRLPRLL
jgi:hypothetical protein